MRDELTTLLAGLKTNAVQFAEVIIFIENHYQHQPTAFKNGEWYNEASQNQGSAKIFAFAQLNELNKEDTLCLLAEHYHAVLANPDGSDHQNIRQFMIYGWERIQFEGEALKLK